ncbi:MAG: tRNA lysidine(34) synthetase TilS, partial [Bacteroidetes bacterium]|nr:tRNA lysidine(34) synthetase TilS [Bacteroidota bacterium]
VIIKLLRQYGSAALHGILPKDGNRVHPLLFATKNEILQYAQQHQLKWREDASNDSDAYQRNKIRRHLLPILQEMNPSFSTNLVEHSEFVYGEDKIIRSYLENVSNQIVTNKEKEVILSIADLKNTLAPLTILYHLIEPFGFSMTQSVSLFNSLSSTESKNFHSEKYCITKNRNELVIFPHTNINSVYFEITDCGVYEYNGKVITVKYEEKSLKEIELSKNTNPYQAWFDDGEVSFPIVIRNKKDGDRFQPFGMINHKKLSDFFIDLKYTAAEKENQWLMESNQEIFWVVGKRISDRARVREESNRILKICVTGF